MRLHRVRIEYLHDLAEVDALHQIVDVLVVEIVREHKQRALDVARLRQTDDQVSQVRDARMYLQDESESDHGYAE